MRAVYLALAGLALGACAWNAPCHRFYLIEDVDCPIDAADAGDASDSRTADGAALTDGAVE